MGSTSKLIGIAMFALAILLMLIFPILALGLVGSISGAGAQSCTTSTLPGSGATTPKPDNGSGPPAKFIPIYQAAAAKYHLGTKGPSVLAGIHSAETGFGDSNGDNQTSTAGAQGPMQFLPSTWSTYGVDGNNDGTKDINNVNDAIFGAARYLRASGAPKDWHGAILSYNKAEWYYQEVWSRAKKYDVPATGGATAQDNTADCSPSTTLSGVQGKIVQIAKSQIGTSETPPGSNIVNKYGASGVPWCALFVSWVWQQAGVKMPTYAYCGDVGSWANDHTVWKQGAGNNPEPGDAVLYANSFTDCDHIGIVIDVDPQGHITTVEGNYGDQVSKRGPFDPKTQQDPHSILGYASPQK